MPKQLKELDNLIVIAAAALIIIGVFVDKTIRHLVPLVAVVGVVIFAAHLVRRRRRRHTEATVQATRKLGG